MQPVAAALDNDDISQLADYYARIAPRPLEPGRPDARLIELGRRIATQGIPQQSVPACIACHRSRAGALFPRLDGQPARYIAGQLRLWQSGGRTGTVQGRIMAAIAPRLDDHQIEAVAAYFQSIPPVQASDAGQSGATGGDR